MSSPGRIDDERQQLQCHALKSQICRWKVLWRAWRTLLAPEVQQSHASNFDLAFWQSTLGAELAEVVACDLQLELGWTAAKTHQNHHGCEGALLDRCTQELIHLCCPKLGCEAHHKQLSVAENLRQYTRNHRAFE